MLLRYALKLEAEADSVEKAIERVLIAGVRTADLAAGGPSVSTNEMTDRIVAAL
jgi:3-isopropylmalate dehydrogenase